MPANSHLTVGGSSWSGNPPLATTRQLLSTSTGLYDYTTTTSNVLQGEIDAIVAGGTTALWANYPAINNVNMSTNNITNAGSITAAGTVTANSFVGALTGNSAGTHTGAVVGNVTGDTNGTHTGAVVGNVTGNVTGNISNVNLTVRGQYSITETADVGSALSNYGNYGTVNISGKGGLGGIVNITADVATPLNPAVTVSQLTAEAKGNYGLITPGTPVGYVPRGGLVSIIARQGLTPTPPAEVTSALFANGEIDLTAYSYGAVPGLIKLSAGANAMYAGAFSPITGIFGNNYIAATIANTMTAGLPPGGVPTLVGTNYFYATLGIGGAGAQIVGNRFQGGVGIDFLQPFPNGDLIIQSNANGTDTVVISGVKSLAMSNGGNITGVGNINLTTINSAAYPPPTLTDPTFNSVSTNQISTGASYISSINGLPMSAYTNVGDATFNSVSTNQISTGASYISSINGLPMSAYTNVGDATFNSISANKISTARISMSSINDSIYFGNLPIGNNIAGINDLAAATGTFNTSLTVNGSLNAGTTLLGATRATGLFRVTNSGGANVATIDTAGAITGTSISVSGAAASGSLAVTNSATIGNGLAVTGGTTLIGTTTAGLVQGTTMTFTNANVTNANLTNTNTGVINAGAGALALTYGSISFNGSPYAPTAGTSSNATFNSISTNSISAAQVFISSINGYEYVPGGGALPPGLISTPNLLGLVSTPNLLGLVSTPNLAGFISTPNLIGLISTPNLAGLLSTYVSSFNNFNVSSFFVSSIQARGGLNFSTPMYAQNGQYDINKTFNLISSSYDAVSSLQNNILNYTYTLGLPAGALVSWAFPPSANLTLVWDEVGTWGSNVNTIAHADPGVNQKQVQISLPNEVYGGTPVPGTFCDWYNEWNVTKMTLYNIGFAPIVDIPWKSTYRVTWTGTSWTVNTSPSPIATTNTTNFNISQNINGAAISTSDILTLTGTSIYMNAETMYAGNIEASNIDVVSISSFTGNISSMTSYITASDYVNAYSTTTTHGLSQSLSNTGTISTLSLGATYVVANYVTVNSNLTAPSITVPSGSFSTLTTNNITNYDTITSLNVNVKGTAANGYLYADSAYTSTFGIQSGLAFPYSLSQVTYSNVEALSNGNFLNVPTTKALMHNENMYISCPNPTYTYTGTGTVTFKTDGTVDIGGTPLTTFGWQQGTFTATNPMTLNVSTPTANAFASNARVANLITTSVGTMAFYTSGGGFAGNIPQSTSLSLIYNTSLLNFTTGTFGALAPILFQSYIQTKQSLQSIETITNVSTINNATYIGFGNKGYQIDTFQIRLEGFLISKTAPNGGAYGFADNGSRITNPITGRTYLLSEWNCIVSLAGHNCYRQVTLAVNEAIVTTQNDGGYWKAQAYMTTATIPLLPGGTNFVYWNVAVTMIPIAMGGITGLQTATVVGDVIPSTIDAFNPWAIETPLAHLSTVTASTFQVIAGTNISLNANLGFPTFLNDGTVSINASTNVDLMANYDITLGAARDINATATSTISLTAREVKLDVNDANIYSFGSHAFRFVKESPYNYLQTVGRPMIITGLYGNDSAFSFDGTGSNKSFRNLDMGNNNINNIFQLNFSNSANIDGTYPNQLNFNASNSYFLGNLRFYGSNRTLDLADNQIYACSYIYGSTGGFLTINAGVGMVIENNQGARQALNSDGSFEFRTTGANKTVYINSDALTFNGSSNNRINNVSSINGNATLAINATTININGNLDMTDGNINNVSTIKAPSGATLRLQNNSGSGFIQLENAGNIYAVANSGATNQGMDSGLIFNNAVNITNKVFGATSAHTFEVYDGSAVLQKTVKINSNGLDMCNAAINNLSSIYFTQGAALTTNAATWTSGSITTLIGDEITGDKYIQWSYDNNPGTLINDNHSISLSAPVINAVGNLDMCNNNIKNVGTFSRMLSSTAIDQPILQFGEDNSGSGASGSVVINLPTSYTSASSYVAFATMEDADPAEMSVVRVSATSIEIYWAQGGSGSHVIAWNTMGT